MISHRRKVILIEKAQKEDLKEILDLQYLAYQSEAKLFGDMEIPPLKQTIEEVYDEFEKGTILKAIDEKGVIIGSVRAYQDGRTVYIGKLMVHPEMQKKGIGTKLLLEIENEYPNQRYELFTSTKSISNIRLYERLGYKIFKEEAVSQELQFVYLQKYQER
ncbi:MAG: GNAT family N-acetyltransferase [Lachnospiraceae bacterium]|nr:GNAT family N-acetyltransferase [Lachnospiraceae bacterium]